MEKILKIRKLIVRTRSNSTTKYLKTPRVHRNAAYIRISTPTRDERCHRRRHPIRHNDGLIIEIRTYDDDEMGF